MSSLHIFTTTVLWQNQFHIIGPSSSSSSESYEDRRHGQDRGHLRARLDTRGLSDDNHEDESVRRENRAVVCGGVTVNNEVINSCFSLDRERQQWVIEPYMKDERAYAAGEMMTSPVFVVKYFFYSSDSYSKDCR